MDDIKHMAMGMRYAVELERNATVFPEIPLRPHGTAGRSRENTANSHE
jgi:hypothetical protein